ncbi:hypothetical protein JAO10_31835 [Burkholderia contaminans]|uniref:hypothetical protein n=1 Tax=Burkholderia cepacia complex TaxID=87882 RepID=UPI0010418EBC|nr:MULTISPECIES: hypothetical protein [Burkholderia cepacia complex]MBH9724928.1 hypothetical protein [Burkholderia contaminans]MBR8092863.1 hypothetical protein [Burkholderia cenocepacia]MDN7456760.1 hypothetical protein [Burkholderia cenocepacia]MDS0807485.1 hypothetical protein [Burkholderia cenocepacia]
MFDQLSNNRSDVVMIAAPINTASRYAVDFRNAIQATGEKANMVSLDQRSTLQFVAAHAFDLSHKIRANMRQLRGKLVDPVVVRFSHFCSVQSLAVFVVLERVFDQTASALREHDVLHAGGLLNDLQADGRAAHAVAGDLVLFPPKRAGSRSSKDAIADPHTRSR